MTWNGQIHPAAELFPMMSGDDFTALVESITAHGLREPVWLLPDGTLLDGRNRVAACEKAGVSPTFRTYTGTDPVAFVMDLNLSRRHLTAGQKAMLAVELVPMLEVQGRERKAAAAATSKPGTRKDSADRHYLSQDDAKRSASQAATIVGTSGRAVARAKRLTEQAPDLAEKVKTGELAVDRAERELKARQRLDRKTAEVLSRSDNITRGTRLDLRVGDFRDTLTDLTDVDAIITDPPYPREYLPLLTDLTEWASKVLAPGGVMAVMFGQSYLPEAIARLSSGPLPYLWTMAYLTPGGQAVQVWDRKVNTFWKPILIYGTTPEWFGDVCKSEANDNDKNHHHWGQSVTGMTDLVQRLVKPGSHIVDPFTGAGTTALAALANGCHFTGADIDADHIATTQERCNTWRPE